MNVIPSVLMFLGLLVVLGFETVYVEKISEKRQQKKKKSVGKK